MNDNQLIPVDAVFSKEEKSLTSSLVVAQVFKKQHQHVIRDIEQKILPHVSEVFGQSNFGLTSYTDQWNREQKMYAITKDGFMMLVMGYNGQMAMQIKEAYITEFNRMEESLRRPALEADDALMLREQSHSMEETFVETIRDLLLSGEWYLYPMGGNSLNLEKLYGNGENRPLGRFDDEYIYIHANTAYMYYKKNSLAPVSGYWIFSSLAHAGIIVPQTPNQFGKFKSGSTYVWKLPFGRAHHGFIKFQRDRVSFPVPDLKTPPKPSKKRL